jgi:hypothetical protein
LSYLAIDAHERFHPKYDDTPLELDLYHRLIANVTVAPDDIPGHRLDGHLESSVYIQHDNLKQIGKLTSSEIIHLDSGVRQYLIDIDRNFEWFCLQQQPS